MSSSQKLDTITGVQALVNQRPTLKLSELTQEGAVVKELLFKHIDELNCFIDYLLDSQSLQSVKPVRSSKKPKGSRPKVDASATTDASAASKPPSDPKPVAAKKSKKTREALVNSTIQAFSTMLKGRIKNLLKGGSVPASVEDPEVFLTFYKASEVTIGSTVLVSPRNIYFQNKHTKTRIEIAEHFHHAIESLKSGPAKCVPSDFKYEVRETVERNGDCSYTRYDCVAHVEPITPAEPPSAKLAHRQAKQPRSRLKSPAEPEPAEVAHRQSKTPRSRVTTRAGDAAAKLEYAEDLDWEQAEAEAAKSPVSRFDPVDW
jgi:hypothetical protein